MSELTSLAPGSAGEGSGPPLASSRRIAATGLHALYANPLPARPVTP